MKRHLVLFIYLFCFFSSCKKSENIIYLRVHENDILIHDITISEYPVTLNGTKIGQVDEFIEDQQGMIMKIQIDKDIILPIDSKFIIKNLDLNGSKGISVQLGTENNKIAFRDTINITEVEIDSLGMVYANSKIIKQQESMFYELNQWRKLLKKLTKQE